MKYIPIAIISTIFGYVLANDIYNGTIAWFGLLWVYPPFLIPIIFAILFFTGKVKSQVVPIAGVITSLIAVLAYHEAYTYEGTDGQIALIFAVMPIYQYIGLLIFSVIGYLLERNRE